MKSLLTLSLLLATLASPGSRLPLRNQSSMRAQAAVTMAYAALTRVDQLDLDVTPEINTLPARPPREATGYGEAYAQFQQQRRPMIVMLTATWCPACPAVGQQLTTLQKQGSLDGATLVLMDIDQQKETAQQIAQAARHLNAGGSYSVPLVVLFTWEGERETVRRVDRVSELPGRLGN